MKAKLTALLGAFAVMLYAMATPLAAGEGPSGFSIGVIQNSATFDTTGKEIEGTGDGETNSTSVTKDVDFPSLFAEYTGGVGGGVTITFGVEIIPGEAELGNKSRTDTTTNASETVQDDGTYTAKAEVSNHAAIYIEPGYMFNDYFGIFAKGGVARATINTLEDLAVGTAAGDSSYEDAEVVAPMVGFGIKAMFPMGIFIKLERVKIDYQEITLKSVNGSKINTVIADPEQDTTRLAIGYNF